ncbi:MFS transporter [Loigolactobacillus bifermentans]|uniref:Transporter, major facilitator family protein n=1 Tax=Loigolactobacillus bifermentans DSM 20003 TaxID=1423726 RepID=A0A0R1H7K7_9LACO|nr:MFS transporter [Loigolactobacillus bifermentans]KRK40595.1 transporter, major facilitator family protein [Loigolactobacillus bifermentans DSM 20003]QGG60722.1 MFS transporter [Loigolactobacillus bifermentans]
MNELTKSKKHLLAICLYLNYFAHGIGLIILAQNMQSLGHFWGVPLATVSYVVSGIGIGRLLAYFVFGYLSDRFGRKFLIYVGIGTYLVFFLGMPFVKSIQLAYLLAILAGVANSALDSGTYPTFMEMGGKESASNVFIKAFMSIGEFVLPLLVTMLETRALWFGWSFMLAVVILVANLILLTQVSFPARNQAHQADVVADTHLSQHKRWVATVALSIYGYTTMAIMILFTQWITLFATKELGYNSLVAHGLLSLYSIGSISGVLVVFVLLRRQVSETGLLVLNNIASLIALLVICYTSVQWLSAVACFMFGFTAASGMMQVALNIFLRLYPTHKGLVTGTYFTFGSIATFTVPIVTGWLSKQSIGAALRFDILVGILGTAMVLIVAAVLNQRHAEATAAASLQVKN